MAPISRPVWDVLNPVAWGQDLASSFGVHGDNQYDPVVQARQASLQAAQSGRGEDIEKLKSIANSYQPGNFADQAEKERWIKQINDYEKNKVEKAEQSARREIYGDMIDPKKGLIQSMEDRQAARETARNRQQLEAQKQLTGQTIASNEKLAGMSNQNAQAIARMQGQNQLQAADLSGRYGLRQADLSGRYGLQQADLTGRYNLKTADLAGRYNLQGVREQGASNERITGITTRSQERVADVTSGRTLEGLKYSTDSAERIGMTNAANERRRATLEHNLGQRNSINQLLLGAMSRSSFK